MYPTTALDFLNSTSNHTLILLVILIFVGITTTLVIYQLLLYPYFLSPLRHVPGPPLGGLIYGQFPAIINGEAGIPQREWVKTYGPIVRAVGPVGIERLILVKPDTLHKILVRDWINYPRPGFMRSTLGLTAGWGLLTVTGEEHRQMRKSINPAFSLPNLVAQMDMYYEPIEGLLQILQSKIGAQERPEIGAVIPMYEWMSKVTLDIICKTAFGYVTDSLHNPGNELSHAYEELISMQSGHLLARFIAILTIPGAPQLIGSKWAYEHRHWFTLVKSLAPLATLMESMHRIKHISATILAEKMQDLSLLVSDTDAKRDIMTLLVRARRADMEKDRSAYAMSDEAMMNQVLTFLGAGHETTASGLAWALWLLANDQESQTRLREEVTPIFAGDPRPSYRTIKDLSWLDCVVMESLRVLPPVPMTFRKAAQTDYIDGILVPKGTILYIPIRIFNTWKELWGDDAEQFRPTRWLNLPEGYNTSSLLTFLSGPHACIGKTMAIMEMKTVLAALIAKFEFSPAYPGQVARPTAAVTMKPEDNMPLQIRKVGADCT